MKKILLWWPMAPRHIIEELESQGYEIVGIVQQKSSDIPSFKVLDLFDVAGYDRYEFKPWYKTLFHRNFTHYFKNISRVSIAENPRFHFFRRPNHFEPSHYSYDEVANRFFLHVSKMDNLLESTKADAVWFSRPPHLALDNLLWEVAAWKKLETLVFQQSIFSDKFFYGRSAGDVVAPKHANGLTFNRHPIADEKNINLFYMKPKAASERKREMELLRAIRKRRFRATFMLRVHSYLINKERLALAALLHFFAHRCRIKLLDELRNKERFIRFKTTLREEVALEDINRKFVYFPLHLEPEATTSEHGGEYRDQIDAVEAMSERMPGDWILLIKENPKQTFFYRSKEFYSRIHSNPRIRWARSDEDTIKLIERCEFVATVTGTAGYEAIVRGKPAVHFGDAWYASLKGAFRFQDTLDVEHIASFTIDPAQVKRDLAALLQTCADGVVYSPYQEISALEKRQSARSTADSIKRIDMLIHGAAR